MPFYDVTTCSVCNSTAIDDSFSKVVCTFILGILHVLLQIP